MDTLIQNVCEEVFHPLNTKYVNIMIMKSEIAHIVESAMDDMMRIASEYTSNNPYAVDFKLEKELQPISTDAANAVLDIFIGMGRHEAPINRYYHIRVSIERLLMNYCMAQTCLQN